MANFGLIDSFMLFGFIRRLTSSFTTWESYKTGVIDSEGNILVPEPMRTYAQKKSFLKFDLLVLNLRKILAKIPGGGSRLGTFAAALYLLKEEKEFSNLDLIEKQVIDLMLEDETLPLMEEITNTVSGGSIAGMNEPPKFAGSRVFDVDMKTLMRSRFGKKKKDRYKKYLGEDETAEEIKNYAKKNPSHSIVLRDKTTNQMIYFRKKQ